MLSANAEMVLTYWDIGRMILERQEREGWGASVIPRLARDLHNELPENAGDIKLPQAVAKISGARIIVQQLVAKKLLGAPHPFHGKGQRPADPSLGSPCFIKSKSPLSPFAKGGVKGQIEWTRA